MLAKRVVLILISLVITACSDSNEGVALGTLERERVIILQRLTKYSSIYPFQQASWSKKGR